MPSAVGVILSETKDLAKSHVFFINTMTLNL